MAKAHAPRLRAEAIAAANAGRHDEAIGLLERVLQQDPEDWKALYQLGDVYARAGQVARALESYRRVADHYEADRYHGKAIAAWRRMLRLLPSFLDIHVKLAELYVRAGRPAEARREYTTLVEELRKQGSTHLAAAFESRLAALDEARAPSVPPREPQE
jgi:tetratricopeptide (TPR) repeat protein